MRNPAVERLLSQVRATSRVMSTPWGRLGWLLWFAQRKDLSQLNLKRRVQIVEELEAFAPSDFGAKKKAPISAASLAAIATALREGVEAIARGHYWKIPVSSMPDLVLYCAPTPQGQGPVDLVDADLKRNPHPTAAKAMERLKQEDVPIAAKQVRGRAVAVRQYGGSLPTRVLMVAFDLLEAEGDRIKQCATCETLFVKRKRGAYCSPRCSQKARSDLFRNRHSEELREKRHQYYLQKVKRERGPKVAAMVRRRNRRTESSPNQKEESNGTQARSE